MTVGSTFASHYQLIEVKNRVPLLNDPPESLKNRFGNAFQHIESGTYGEVWKALDTRTGEYVVIKLFIAPVMGVEQYVTWSLAGHDWNLIDFLVRAVDECQIAIDMQSFSKRSPMDLEAASHILKCKEDHVRMPLSATGHQVDSRDIVYHIFEFAGDYTLDKWMDAALKKDSAAQYVDRCLRILQQLVGVLHYFSSHTKKWVHHDLKPANIVVRNGADGRDHITIIDLGSALEVSENNANRSSAGTLEYSPFEGWDLQGLVNGVVRARGLDVRHVSSFDMYSVGVIFHEMITGELLVDNVVEAELTDSEILEMQKHLENCNKFPRASEGICQRLILFYAAGRPGGCVQRFLSNFSEDVMATSDEAHLQVSTEFQERARATSWYATFRRIIAYAPSDRPTPQEVLASNMLQRFKFEDALSSPPPDIGTVGLESMS